MAREAARVIVEVVDAREEEQVLLCVSLPRGSTLRDAIDASGLAQHPAAPGSAELRAGIFGREQALDTPLNDGDRVEIYRALRADPKEARRRRAPSKRGPQAGR